MKNKRENVSLDVRLHPISITYLRMNKNESLQGQRVDLFQLRCAMKSDLRERTDAIQDADRRVPDEPTTVLYLPCLKISLACEGGSIELLSFSYTHSCQVTPISDRGLVHPNFPSLSARVFFKFQFSSNRATFSLFDRFAREQRIRTDDSS